jgi:hypothetical protein
MSSWANRPVVLSAFEPIYEAIMGDTKAQVEAEKWIREIELPRMFQEPFRQRSLGLRSKGQFKFDAVSDDGKTVAVISTSGGSTSSGKLATAKLMKIRTDVYWFLLLQQQPERRLLVFTDQSMIDLINDEKKKGRFPPEFELVRVTLPPDLAAKVAASQKVASEEVSPRRNST